MQPQLTKPLFVPQRMAQRDRPSLLAVLPSAARTLRKDAALTAVNHKVCDALRGQQLRTAVERVSLADRTQVDLDPGSHKLKCSLPIVQRDPSRANSLQRSPYVFLGGQSAFPAVKAPKLPRWSRSDVESSAS